MSNNAASVNDTSPVTLSAEVFGDPNCGGSTISSLRVVVVQLG